MRGVREELSLEGELDFTYLAACTQMEKSVDYPGLEARFFRSDFRLELKPEQFNPSGYVERQRDKDSYFAWAVKA